MSEILNYNGKPLLQNGCTIYYGDTTAKFIIIMDILTKTVVSGKEIADAMEVKLCENDGKGTGKVLRRAERSGLYRALDIASFWLDEASDD